MMGVQPVLRLGGNWTAPGRSLWLWCPGCEDSHRITIDWPNGWFWDGDEQAPTITPSILVTGVQWSEGAAFHKPRHVLVLPGQRTVCHSFVRSGRWEYLTDSTHVLAGQTVPLVPLPEWLEV